MSALTTKAAEIRAGLVKPLEWRGGDGSWSAQALRGVYGIYAIGGRYRLLYSWSSALWDSEHASLEEAKAAALAEHESRILSALNLALIEQQAAELAAVGKVKHYLRMAEVEDSWSAMIDECEAMEARATTAESERDEWRKDHADLYALHMRRSAERDEARAALQVAKDGWRDAEATIASQSERIAVLEAALRPFADVADVDEETGRDDPEDDRILVVQAYGCQLAELSTEDLRRARSALAPLGEE